MFPTCNQENTGFWLWRAVATPPPRSITDYTVPDHSSWTRAFVPVYRLPSSLLAPPPPSCWWKLMYLCNGSQGATHERKVQISTTSRTQQCILDRTRTLACRNSKRAQRIRKKHYVMLYAYSKASVVSELHMDKGESCYCLIMLSFLSGPER